MSLLKKFGYLLLDQTETEGSTFDFIITSLLKIYIVPLRSEKAGMFEKLLGFARSHFIVALGPVSVSCATTPQPTCFFKS